MVFKVWFVCQKKFHSRQIVCNAATLQLAAEHRWLLRMRLLSCCLSKNFAPVVCLDFLGNTDFGKLDQEMDSGFAG